MRLRSRSEDYAQGRCGNSSLLIFGYPSYDTSVKDVKRAGKAYLEVYIYDLPVYAELIVMMTFSCTSLVKMEISVI